jgi:cytochrome b561
MRAWNTPERYGTVAIALHWIIAGLFLVSYSAVYLPEFFVETTRRGPPPGLSVHQAVGISIFVFAALRLGWRFINVAPEELQAPDWQRWAAKTVHVLLYLGMFLMPITGYLGTGGPTNLYFFSLPAFKDTSLFQTVFVNGLGVSWDSFEKPLDAFHFFVGGNILWILIAMHVGAALYHHLIMYDRTLARMAYGI